MNPNPTEPANPPPAPPGVRVAAGLATRRTAIAVVSVIAGVAAYVSFRHQHGLAMTAGEPVATAWTLPVLIDGVIIMGSLVMLDASRRGDKAPWLARLALIAGAVATLAANVAHGWSGGLASSLISAVAPIVLVVAYELLMGMLRRTPRPAAEPVPEPAPEPVEDRTEQEAAEPNEPFAAVAATVEEAARLAYEASVIAHEPLSERKLSDRFKLSRTAARTIIGEVVDEEVMVTLRMQGRPPHPDHLIDRFGITERRAVELINARLADWPTEPVEDSDPAGVEPVAEPLDAGVRHIVTRLRHEALLSDEAFTDRPALTTGTSAGGAA
ncbi:very large tegument protein [[Actinomadura] parvosata subsp. kistnae]|uniref:DUF2637 domain-containing protein n=1 Tax=[Actinomadura] parvosata subsp. kistnae TaxID=1909395 RepID=A0A1V0AAL0_9ACTN|nr:DUF2637 domain-containing protein [Nonomuraea sp. ATCC 55076]AQZ67246.1 hypothetical protein BKM31_42505 [Nonomuraea sp. ATCC 55076]SPL94537.1 very large tegument protein [Actinomadura parvosata subsp. kistnae]